MREIIEYESTTTNAQNDITRDNSGPTYKYADICQDYDQTYTYYTDATNTQCQWDTDQNGVIKVDDNGNNLCKTKTVKRCA